MYETHTLTFEMSWYKMRLFFSCVSSSSSSSLSYVLHVGKMHLLLRAWAKEEIKYLTVNNNKHWIFGKWWYWSDQVHWSRTFLFCTLLPDRFSLCAIEHDYYYYFNLGFVFIFAQAIYRTCTIGCYWLDYSRNEFVMIEWSHSYGRFNTFKWRKNN